MIKIMDSQSWRLEDDDGKQVEVGQVIIDRDEKSFELSGGMPPHKPSSSGRVYGTWANGQSGEYFPHVFNLRWVEMGIRGSV
tara:strand:+ start:330 stop:575 length:246 start_codon:yes stop_codon:yes gene_type:complete